MCGLYGMIAKFQRNSYTDLDISHFWDMSIITSLRGRDSSGIWGINKDHLDRDPRMWKKIGDPFYLINAKESDQIEKFIKDDAIAMFGHGRKATIGKVTLQNAHPFRYKNITLMHNGTIHGGLEEKDKEIEVDSHALTILVQEKGVQAALSQVEGAFAIICYDIESKTIQIARNNQRPLHYVEHNDMIYIMSDKLALQYIMDRAGRTGTSVVKEFDAMKVYEIDPAKPTISNETKKISYPPVKTTYYDSTKYHNSWEGGWEGWPPNKEAAVKVTHINSKSKSFDDTTWKIKRGQRVKFVVENAILPEGSTNWKFWGRDDDGNSVVFFAPDMHNEWLDCVAEAPVLSAWPDHVTDSAPELVYIVRLKDLDWLPMWDDLTENEQNRILKDLKCYVCDQPFIDDDSNNLHIKQRNPLEAAHGECEHTLREMEQAIKEAANE
jgi:predicted glutamine amidotransferase